MLRNLTLGVIAASTLVIVGLGFGANVASAGVIFNERVDVVVSNDNPCETGANPISLAGEVHYVFYTTPDGTLKMNNQLHLTGTDADGTEYVVNIQRHMEHWAWPSFAPATDKFTTNLMSKGSTVNAQIVMTIDTSATPPVITATACRG